jgi:hypothetical protein
MLQSVGTRRGPRLAAVAVALLMLGNTGCLVFERQTLVFAFPKGGKEVRALFLYEGMRVGGDKPNDLASAHKQLGALAANDHFLYGGHFMIPIEIEKIDPKDTDSDQAKMFRLFLKANLKVRGEGFYLNKEGRLCFAQTVTITDAPRMLTELNAIISSEINTMTAQVLAGAQRRSEWMDDDTVKLLHKASSEKSYDWLKIEPGRISFTMPMSPAVAANLKRDLFRVKDIQALRKQVEGTVPPNSGKRFDVRDSLLALELVATFFSEVPFSVDHRHDRVILAVGVGDGQPIRIPAPFDESVPKKGAQDEELIKFARTLKVPFKEGMTAESAVADFLKAVK